MKRDLAIGLIGAVIGFIGMTACHNFWKPRPGYKPVAACQADVAQGAEVDCDAVNEDNNECYSCEKVVLGTACYDRDRYCAKDKFCSECTPKRTFERKARPDAGVPK